jgi:hypothetical protein
LRKQIVIGKVLRSRRDISTHNFKLGIIFSHKGIKYIVAEVNEWKLQHVDIVIFRSKLRLRHEYNRWKFVLERNEFKESYLGVVHCYYS